MYISINKSLSYQVVLAQMNKHHKKSLEVKLRPLASSFSRTEIRNGESSYFWVDDWLGTRRIIDKT